MKQIQNLSRKELIKLLNRGELVCACAHAPATSTCIDECHLLVDDTTRKVVSARVSWERS